MLFDKQIMASHSKWYRRREMNLKFVRLTFRLEITRVQSDKSSPETSSEYIGWVKEFSRIHQLSCVSISLDYSDYERYPEANLRGQATDRRHMSYGGFNGRSSHLSRR